MRDLDEQVMNKFIPDIYFVASKDGREMEMFKSYREFEEWAYDELVDEIFPEWISDERSGGTPREWFGNLTMTRITDWLRDNGWKFESRMT